jgi:hypothetical protein
MHIQIKKNTQWCEVLNTARVTVGKKVLEFKEPSDKFKEDMIRSEHSPLRNLTFTIQIEGIKSWVATHFTRHTLGFEPFVKTQRTDRTGEPTPRDDLPQGAPVDMFITLNAQAFINVSSRRMCHESSKETRGVWYRIIGKLKALEPALASACVPQCVYRGFCPESKYAEDNCKLNWKPWRAKYLAQWEEEKK